MTAMSITQCFYIAFLIFLGYFLILLVFYIFLAVMGIIEQKKRTWEDEIEDYPQVYFSSFAPPVSIIRPAHNEEEWIRDSLLSALNQNYPEFEIIIVDDGSTDRTSAILNEILDLKTADEIYIKHYRDGRVRELSRSSKYPLVTVISKVAGAKKAGAVNAGLNIVKYKYVCIIDADTIIEPNALLRVMAHVAKDPDKVIGIGSYFGLSNGLKVKDGRIVARTFSYNPIVAYQNLEYIRSFIGNRIGWSKFNATPNVAGGFGVWRRDVLYDLGGCSVDFTCEDLELTFRAHDYLTKNKEKGYKIITLPYYVSWTEGPNNIGALISQRDRWQRVVNETTWKYKYMLCNPKYGAFAFLVFPYYIFYEVFGAFFEVVSIAMVGAGWLAGILDIRIFLTYYIFMVLSQCLVSLLSIFAFVRGQKIFRIPYIAYLVFLSFLEFVWYRWIISIAKFSGMYHYAHGVRVFNQYSRAKRVK